MEIKIGIGLDDIIFGMLLDDVTAIVGKADKIVYELEDIKYTEKETAHYFNRQLVKINFDVCSRLCSIKVFNPNAIIFDMRIIGKHKDEIINILSKNMYYKIRQEEYDTFEAIICDEICCMFRFQFNILKSIEFWPLFDDNDREIWPMENVKRKEEKKYMEIKIGVGLDDIFFGMSRSDVTNILGEPNKISETEKENGIVCYYNKQLIKMKYDILKKHTLYSIEVYNPIAILFNCRVISKERKEIIDLLEFNGYYDFVVEEYGFFDTLFCEKIWSTFTFEFDKLTNIEFSPTTQT